MDRMGESNLAEDVRNSLDPVIKSYEHGFIIVVRVAGSMLDKHTILVAESRYDRVFQRAELAHSYTVIVHAEQMSPGGLHHLQKEVEKLRDLCPSTPEIILDVTRSPYIGMDFPYNPDVIQLTSMANDKWLGSTRYLGRLLLLSALSTRIRDRRLQFRLQDTPAPPMVGVTDFERALSTVQAKLPSIEVEEAMLSDTGPDDDLALCVGLASFFAAEHMPDPMYRPENRPFIVKPNTGPTYEWVV